MVVKKKSAPAKKPAAQNKAEKVNAAVAKLDSSSACSAKPGCCGMCRSPMHKVIKIIGFILVVSVISVVVTRVTNSGCGHSGGMCKGCPMAAAEAGSHEHHKGCSHAK